MKVTLLMAQSVDGKVAKTSNEFIDWTTKEDKKLFVKETKRAGVVIMGRKTFDTIGKPLPDRHIIVVTRSPRESITLDGASVTFATDPPTDLIQKLQGQGHEEVIVAGGPTVNAMFLEAGLINEIKLTIEPMLFGRGLSLFEGIDTNITLELLDLQKLTEHTIFLHYGLVREPTK
jgi:dihydrofolate reductase